MGNFLSSSRWTKRQRVGGLAMLDDASLISLLARLPLACRGSIRVASRRCSMLLCDDRVWRERQAAGFTEMTLAAALGEGQLCLLVDGTWRRCTSCPLANCKEWDSAGRRVAVRGSERIAVYDAWSDAWKILPNPTHGPPTTIAAHGDALFAVCRGDGRVRTERIDRDSSWAVLSDQAEGDEIDVRMLAAVCAGQLVGFGSRRAYCLDLDGDGARWVPKSRIPEYRYDDGNIFAVAVAEKIYGFRLRYTRPHTDFELSRMFVFDPSGDFETAPPALDGLSSGFLVPLERSLLLVPLPHDRAHQSAWELDVATMTWTKLQPPLPRPSVEDATGDFACLLPVCV